jgi:hypothetical protein
MDLSSPDYQKEREIIFDAIENGKVISSNHPSIFPELQRILAESLMSQKDILLCDMPELLLRMKIGANNSLKDMQDMFNAIMNSIAKK